MRLLVSALLVLTFGLAAPADMAQAQDKGAVQVASGVSYEFIARWDVAGLNQILKVDTPKFAGVPVTYTPARDAVRLYYGVPGLARSVLNDDVYEVSRKAYLREPFDPAQIPTDLRKLVRAEYFDPQFFAASAYGKLVAATQAYRWVVKSPLRTFYGETDEAISTGLGQLPMTYQRAIGNKAVEAVSTGATTHRGTFAVAVPQWKAWFDEAR